MGFFGLLFPWGVLLQALAIVHFIRRRPDTLWLWIIIFLGPLGAAVYIVMEVVPDLEHVTSRDPKYDLHRAAALLAHAYANTAQPEKAEALFQQVTQISTAS